MKKRYLMPIIGAVSASAVAGYLLKNEDSRMKLTDNLENIKQKIKKNSGQKQHTTLEAAGIPDQIETSDQAQIDNADMVSEGSQYGVDYYNKVVQDESSN